MVGLPLFKLGILLVRTAAKPIASRLKSRAKGSPNLSAVCERIGQGWHSFSSRINLQLLGHQVKKIKPLGTTEAIDSGADFLGEGFIYSVSAIAIVLEVWRNDKKSAAQKLEKEERRAEKQRRLMEEDLRLRVEINKVSERVSQLSAEQDSLRALLEEVRERQLAAGRKRWGFF